MRLYTFPADRVKRTRACSGCGIMLKPETPAHHRNCPKCWSFGQYRKAVFAFLDSTRPGR